ncbi:hypothetical protein LTR48_006171 [Friedmanniomyces endolithicus]|uniref:Uncharacterized protein n=1 Tax=Rachicladosporium monterosium TaxID=1507873 RepID=A0ABR0KZD4_9PEZI|nr:hypothetical protein LTS02_014137 [Friedmanniomyces endolithicus]KAK0875556.1 hypothetical protein LTR87_010613 [Friedmanniomyces endolithicus]KAK0946248.1 hypothetical protein LTR29_002296 [Friedmanniomyces endolithicus]KAK1091505.1 hypothetical protein LTR48_006171 [Friedmanniomyces endolithicus]KAK5141097.1 hypothetical protein LTR32_006262 [Rachicladosporium monterosium]
MDRKERPSPQGAPSSRKHENTPTTSATQRASRSTVKPRKSLKGRVEYVEIGSDEERAMRLPPLKGVLAGLDPNVVLASIRPPITRHDDKENHHGGDSDSSVLEAVRQSKHETRAARHGKVPALTNLKYHPMDEVLFPSRAAKNRLGLSAKSVVMKLDSDDETSDSSGTESPADSESNESESETDDDDEIPVLTQRTPDPRAIRHSARSEAQKAVNYSRKFHPQDLALRGHRSKASAAIKAGQFPMAAMAKRRESVEACSDDAILDWDGGSKNMKPTASARKRLKSTASGSPAAIKARGKSQHRRRHRGRQAPAMKLGDMDSMELGAVMSETVQGSHKRPLSVSDDRSEDESDPDDPSADLDMLLGMPPAMAYPPEVATRLMIVKPYHAEYELRAFDPRTLLRNSPPMEVRSMVMSIFSDGAEYHDTLLGEASRDCENRSPRAVTPEIANTSSEDEHEIGSNATQQSPRPAAAAGEISAVGGNTYYEKPSSHFADQLAVTELNNKLHGSYPGAHELFGTSAVGADLAPQHDNIQSSSSQIVPHLDDDNCHPTPSTSASSAAKAAETEGMSASYERSIHGTNADAILAAKAQSALEALPIAKQLESPKRSEPPIAADSLAIDTPVSGLVLAESGSKAARSHSPSNDAEGPGNLLVINTVHAPGESSACTSSPDMGLANTFDGASEDYELLWRCSGKPGSAV